MSIILLRLDPLIAPYYQGHSGFVLTTWGPDLNNPVGSLSYINPSMDPYNVESGEFFLILVPETLPVGVAGTILSARVYATYQWQAAVPGPGTLRNINTEGWGCEGSGPGSHQFFGGRVFPANVDTDFYGTEWAPCKTDEDVEVFAGYTLAELAEQIASQNANFGIRCVFSIGARVSFYYSCTDLYLELTGDFTAPVTVTPNTGGTLGGDPVTLTGAGFVPGTTVTFDGVSATDLDIVSETELTCLTPAHAAGAVDVVVTFPDMSTATLANGFSYGIAASTPTVDAGQAQTAQGPAPSTVTLAAIITRGQNNGTITQAWTHLSGPATPTISSPSALMTDIVIETYVPGTHVFQITITTEDLEGMSFTATDTVAVTVPSALAPRVSSGSRQI